MENILKNILRQGNHSDNLTMLHKMIITEARSEFIEDNNITLIDWMTECYQHALDEHEMGIALYIANDHHNPQHHIDIKRGLTKT
jgi:hypothetical protein